MCIRKLIKLYKKRKALKKKLELEENKRKDLIRYDFLLDESKHFYLEYQSLKVLYYFDMALELLEEQGLILRLRDKITPKLRRSFDNFIEDFDVNKKQRRKAMKTIEEVEKDINKEFEDDGDDGDEEEEEDGDDGDEEEEEDD